MKLSIVVPAHNEEENITDTVENIERAVSIEHELLVVDDHSTDATVGLVQGLCAKYSNLRLISNRSDNGFANAVKTGFANVHTNVVVPVMGDLCDDLATIERMFRKIEEGYDVVCGARYIKGGARIGGSKLKGFFSWFAGKTLYYILGLPTHDIANAFKMFRKEVIDSIVVESRGFEISMEMVLRAYYAGFKIAEVPTVWRERTKGKSSFKMLRLFPSYLKIYLWGIFRRFF
ncbi:MAG: glycosyltransferase [Candidatus Omnitrophota bacterium]